MNWIGLLIGVISFLVIGLFHPLVIKVEYYWGTKSWWIFLLLGLIFSIASLLIDNMTGSIVCGIFAFSCFWSIREIFEQEQRVLKGWFPKNPNRAYTKDRERQYIDRMQDKAELHGFMNTCTEQCPEKKKKTVLPNDRFIFL